MSDLMEQMARGLLSEPQVDDTLAVQACVTAVVERPGGTRIVRYDCTLGDGRTGRTVELKVEVTIPANGPEPGGGSFEELDLACPPI
jgi:hypothetical protein